MGTLAYVSGVELLTDTLSEIVTITQAGNASVTNGILVVNGIDSGVSSAVSPGDDVQVKLQSHSNFISSTYSVLDIDGEQFLFHVITKRDPSTIYSPAFRFFDKFSKLGVNWTPSISGNAIGLFNISSESFAETVIDHNAPAIGTVTPDTEYYFVADYHNNSVYRLDTDTLSTIQRIQVGSRPSSIVYTPSPAGTEKSTVYVTCAGDNKVYRLASEDYAAIDSISVGSNPIYSLFDSDTNSIWVANFNSGTVTKITVNLETYGHTEQTISVGNGPHHIAQNSTDIFVSCANSDQIYRINKTTNSSTPVNVGGTPWSVTISSSTYYYVACSYDGTIQRRMLSNNVLDTTWNIGGIPDVLLEDLTSSPYLFVSDSENNRIASIEKATGSVQTYSPTLSKVFGIARNADDDNLIGTHLFYPNAPSRLVARDYDLSTGIVFPPKFGEALTSIVESDELTISGTDQILPVSIGDNTFNAYILKNTINVGSSTSVEEGDTIAVGMETSSTPEDLRSIRVAVGDYVADFEVTTAQVNSLPNGFTFSYHYNQTLSLNVDGGTHSILGIDPGVILNTTSSAGSNLIKNTVSQGTSASYELNDTISIDADVPADYNTTYISLVDMGLFELPFVVQSQLDPNHRVLSPSHTKLLPVEFPDSTGIADPREVTLYSTDLVTEATVTTDINSSLPGTPPASEYNNTDDYMLFADYIGNRIIRVKTDGTPVQEITSSDIIGPYSVSFAPRLADNPGVLAKPIVSSAFADKVIVLERNGWTQEHVVSVGQRPLGVTGGRELTGGSFEFYVCCYDADKIQHVTYDGSTFTSVDINVPANSGPTAITLSQDGTLVYATLFKTNKVVIIQSDVIIDTIDVQTSPIEIVTSQHGVFVANLASSSVSWINDAGIVIENIPVSSCPVNISVDGTSLYVTHLESEQYNVVEFNVSVEGLSSFVRNLDMPSNTYLYGSSIISGNLYTLRQYPARTSRLTTPVLWPTTAVIENVTDITKGLTVDTPVFNPTGANQYPIRMEIPNLFNGRIVVNEVEVGSVAYLYETDDVKVRIDAVNETAYLHNVPLIFEGHIIDLRFTTEPDLELDPLVFIPQFDLYINEYGYSNIVTVSGITAGYSSDISADPFVGVILNEVDITNIDPELPTEFSVQNGDTIQLYALPGRPYGATAQHRLVTHGGIEYFFELTSLPLNNSEHSNLNDYYTLSLGFNNDIIYYMTTSAMLSPDNGSIDNIKVMDISGFDYDTQNAVFNQFEPFDYNIKTSLLVQQGSPDPLSLNTFYYVDLVDLLPSFVTKVINLVDSPDFEQIKNNTISNSDTNFEELTESTILFTGTSSERNVPSTTLRKSISSDREFFNRPRYTTVDYERNVVNTEPKINITLAWYEVRHSEFIDSFWSKYTYDQVAYDISIENHSYDFVSINHLYEWGYHEAGPRINDNFIKDLLYYRSEFAPYFSSYAVNITWSPVMDFIFGPEFEQVYAANGGFSYDELWTMSAIQGNTPEKVQPKIEALNSPSFVTIEDVKRVGVPITALIKFETGTSSNFSHLTPVSHTEEWFDNTAIYSITEKGYFTSQALAEADAVSNGHDINDVLTVEIEPGGWIWGYVLDDNTNACDIQTFRVKGWIRGG